MIRSICHKKRSQPHISCKQKSVGYKTCDTDVQVSNLRTLRENKKRSSQRSGSLWMFNTSHKLPPLDKSTSQLLSQRLKVYFLIKLYCAKLISSVNQNSFRQQLICKQQHIHIQYKYGSYKTINIYSFKYLFWLFIFPKI